MKYKSDADIRDLIENLPYFKNLTKEHLNELQNISNIRHYQDKEMIFREGEPAKYFYVLLEGQVQIYKTSREGKEIILHLFSQPGEVFADFPFFSDIKQYPAYALCLQPATLLVIEGNSFSNIIKTKCSMAFNVIELYAKRLLEFTKLVEDLSLKNVEARLAKYILSVSETASNQAEIPIHKKTLASILGTIPETLSRSFKKLSDEEIISVNKHGVLILDRNALESLADMKTETAI